MIYPVIKETQTDRNTTFRSFLSTEKVLVTTYETPGSETEQDEGSLKEQKMSGKLVIEE